MLFHMLNKFRNIRKVIFSFSTMLSVFYMLWPLLRMAVVGYFFPSLRSSLICFREGIKRSDVTIHINAQKPPILLTVA